MGGHLGNAMDDVRLQQLLQEAEEHLRARSCRQRYERAVVRLRNVIDLRELMLNMFDL